ncbi:MAG: DcaP family trimeric outer membrane transporter [Pseudomonadota bacterium]
MTRKQILVGTAATLSLLQPAFGQDARVADLERRVAELESQPELSFGPSGTEVSIYGFVRAEAFYDSDFQQGDLTRTGRIGEPAFATDGAFDTSVRVSRFGIRTSTDTDIGTVGTQLEFDLFGSGGDDSGSPNLRLRHANVTIDDTWLFGQFWTNFMPLSHYPRTADFNGPVGITFARQPQIRYSGDFGDLAYSVSIEESNGTSNDPVFTAAAAYTSDSWSARIAGLVGQAESGGSSFDTNGLTLSGSVEPWDGGAITATYVTGEGIGSYLIGGGDEVVGGVVNDAEGYTIEFRQQVGERWNFGIAYGREDYDLATATDTLDFTELETVHVNAFYAPTDNLTLGLEYIQGERTTSTGATFDADRVGASVTFSF